MRRGRHRREYSEHALLTDCSLAQSFMKSVPSNVHVFGTSESTQLGEESVCRRRQEGSSKILQETRLQGRFDIAHEELYEEKRTPTSHPTRRSSCCRQSQRKELGSARCGRTANLLSRYGGNYAGASHAFLALRARMLEVAENINRARQRAYHLRNKVPNEVVLSRGMQKDELSVRYR